MPGGITPATDVDGVIDRLLALVEESAEAGNATPGGRYGLKSEVQSLQKEPNRLLLLHTFERHLGL